MNRDMTAAERREHWAEHYESEDAPEWNCRPGLLACVEVSFEYLEMLLGPKAVAGPLACFLQPPYAGAPQVVPGADWRATLATAGPRAYANWPVADLFWQLGLYGRYGVTEAHIPLSQRDAHIDQLLETGVAFWEASPFAQLKKRTGDRRYGLPVDRVVRLAWNRKTLDDHTAGTLKGSLDPAAVAILGGVSEGRLRNLMSEGRTFQIEGGLITADSACHWLQDRPAFWNSIWREEE